MRQLSKIVSLLTIMLSQSILSYSYDFEVEGIYYGYNPSSQTAYVTSGDKEYKGDITIPSTVSINGRTMNVISIAPRAFYQNDKLLSITLSDGITSIGDEAFYCCTLLNNITLPKTLSSIGIYYYASQGVFYGCQSLKSIIIPDGVKCLERRTFRGCSNLVSISLGRGVEVINDYVFDGCVSLHKVFIPNNVKTIGEAAFSNCSGLDTLVFEDSETPLEIKYKERNESDIVEKIYGPSNWYFGRDCQMKNVGNYWQNLKNLSIGDKVKSQTFSNCYALENIYCMTDSPELVSCNFSSRTYVNAHLYVPTGTINKYKVAEGWKNFFNIQEMDVADMWDGKNDIPTSDEPKEKCAKPTIRYYNGKLLFESSTEGAICQSTITDSDITSYSGNEVNLGVTYNISVYATATGYENSEVATATLCWIDVEPKTEGIENGINQVRANAILIQSNNGTLIISGADDGTSINIYTTSGVIVGSAKASSSSTSINTGLRHGEIAIVKIGNKSVKVVMR